MSHINAIRQILKQNPIIKILRYYINQEKFYNSYLILYNYYKLINFYYID